MVFGRMFWQQTSILSLNRVLQINQIQKNKFIQCDVDSLSVRATMKPGPSEAEAMHFLVWTPRALFIVVVWTYWKMSKNIDQKPGGFKNYQNKQKRVCSVVVPMKYANEPA